LARLMMDKGPEFALLLARSAGKNQQWHALREGAGDGVHHIVPAGAIRHADNADLAGRPGIAVRRKADPRFMREGEHVKAVPLAEREEQLEGEITGDAEDLANADFLQIGDQKIAERHVPLHARHLSSPRSPRTCGQSTRNHVASPSTSLRTGNSPFMVVLAFKAEGG